MLRLALNRLLDAREGRASTEPPFWLLWYLFGVEVLGPILPDVVGAFYVLSGLARGL